MFRIPTASLVSAAMTFALVPALMTTRVASAADEKAPATESADPAAATQKSIEALQTDVKKIKGLKFSGFIQARYERNQSSKDGITSDGRTPANKDQFYIRRARLKTTYTAIPWSEVMLQIDATGAGLSLIDAEVSVFAPTKAADVKLTLGQTKVPFGFEIAQSSWERELPERTQVINRLFPGVRDRGLKLSVSYKFLRLAAGVFNGNGISDNNTTYLSQKDKDGDGEIGEGEEATTTSATVNFGNVDRDKKKDFSGRLGVDFGIVAGGLNFYTGQWGVINDLIATTDPDTNVTTYTGGDELTYLKKSRIGADAQVNLDLIKPLGKTILRGEYITGHGVFSSGKQQDTDTNGWYGLLVQNLGSKVAVAARVEKFDPDTASDEDDITTIEPAVLFFPTQAIRVTASYQLVQDFDKKNDDGSKSDKENNQLTLQLQGKF